MRLILPKVSPNEHAEWASVRISQSLELIFSIGVVFVMNLLIVKCFSGVVAKKRISQSRPQPLQIINEIQLYSVRTGKKHHSIVTSVTYEYTRPVSCIQFSRGMRSELSHVSELRASDPEPVSLVASQGGQIMEWSCQERSIDDESDLE